MSEELQPCPFCGGAPVICTGDYDTTIECNNRECYVQPSYFYEANEDGEDTEAGCIEGWNHRPAPPTRAAGER